MLEITDGKLVLAPVGENPQNIIDLGTGTGIWCIDAWWIAGDRCPNASVLGLDLSPIQPLWVPPNVKFLVEDMEDAWVLATPFDLVHMRAITPILKNPTKVLASCYENIKPGGWIELQEPHVNAYCDDGTMPDNYPVKVFYELLQKAFRGFGTYVHNSADLVPKLDDAGFVNVKEQIMKVPIGTWVKNKTLRLVGLYWRSAIMDLLPAMAGRPFLSLGMSKEEIEVFLASVRQALLDTTVHSLIKITGSSTGPRMHVPNNAVRTDVETSFSMRASEMSSAATQMQLAPAKIAGEQGMDMQASPAERTSLSKENKNVVVQGSNIELRGDRLRYLVTLSAPTAMVKSRDDIPITYLNKGQTYSISIIDTAPSIAKHTVSTYRTSVRICFDSEDQRARPAGCWQLWKEGRGIHEAHQRGGNLEAVEFVAPDGASGLNRSVASRFELQSVDVDGFVVEWSPIGHSLSECTLGVRFHFLSTDFSHSKGVIGYPLRLCVKTVKTEGSGYSTRSISAEADPEICYCKVKLFRDHGAERKLSNDVAHVKKIIDNLEQRTVQAALDSNQSGMGEPNASDISNPSNAQAPLLSTHKRTWSTSFGDGNGDNKRDLRENPQVKIEALRNMFHSSRPSSVLFLKADELDDPDLYPVTLSHPDNVLHREHIERRPVSRLSMSSAGSYSSRASSPPRASSTDFDTTQIMPSLIPFEDYLPNSVQKQPWSLESPPAPSGDEYTYRPIDPDDVRLLALIQGIHDEAIYCSLKVLPLSRLEGSQLGYQALSYAWGDEPASKQIFLQDIEIAKDGLSESQTEKPDIQTDQIRPQRFLVRCNLYAALKRLRSESEDLWFWIDALCINQNDDAEKSNQLPKMLDIFCNAWNVCIWLGETEPVHTLRGAHDPLDFISTIVNLKLLDSIVESDDPNEDTAASFVAFANLLRRPWFRRRWVIQEVAASSRASVQCGSKKVNWIDFADAVQLFLAKLGRIRALYTNSKLFRQDPDALAHVESTGASAIVRASDNVLRKTETGKVVARLWDIEYLVSTFVHFEASEPRDVIYALLPLASDGHLSTTELVLYNAPSLDPDYSKPTLQIYAEFIRHCVRSSGSLDIICRLWALPPKDHIPEGPRPESESSYSYGARPRIVIPSYIGLVTSSASGPPAQPFDRLNKDSLVGEPGRKIYNASRGRPAEIRFRGFATSGDAGDGLSTEAQAPVSRHSNLPHRFTLHAKGFRLAPIRMDSTRTVDGIVSYDGLKLAGWVRNAELHKIPDRLWRTLVADRGSDGSKAPSWWRRACMYCLAKANRDGDLNTSRLIDNHAFPETILEYLRRVQTATRNRKIFVCTESTSNNEWLLGLGPSHAKEGDWACILFGCSVPVVLREYRSNSSTKHFEFIGECYIYGMMDGEALALLDEKPTNPIMEFNIQ
ncbi:hypothetical protein BP6252_10215 [Coleophoma cylindrospora]|uniref:Grh/CP2 DB domain-containing protein n=1 Tax=Coleophoma cylindrospora TaxID=1849047 RepID=A0A3D8QY10_9HELO|nr:hypothetical protein BP6252_10215 [Coleophoma cylindrospora]